MRTTFTIISLFICTCLFSQTHIEYISEKTDSMALISKADIDIINNVFSERNMLDSLLLINEQLIVELEDKTILQDSIITKQNTVIKNGNLMMRELEQQYNETVRVYTKDLEREKRKKVSFQVLTGVSIVGIIFAILFGN